MKIEVWSDIICPWCGLGLHRLDANGVPFFVIDRRYGIAGAQPADDLLTVLQQEWDEAHPLEMGLGGEGDADLLCGADSCIPAVVSAPAASGA
jgi:predicted DsbA family dithiol-disulfide isomerase